MSLNKLSSATSVHDVESDLHYVEMVYKRWNNKRKEYSTYTDFINTEPICVPRSRPAINPIYALSQLSPA